MSDNNDRVYLGTKGHVLAVDASTGVEIWRTTLPFSGLAASGVVMIHPDGGYLYVGYAGHAFCLDSTTGKVVWVNELPQLGYQPVTVATESADPAQALMAAADDLRRRRNAR